MISIPTVSRTRAFLHMRPGAKFVFVYVYTPYRNFAPSFVMKTLLSIRNTAAKRHTSPNARSGDSQPGAAAGRSAQVGSPVSEKRHSLGEKKKDRISQVLRTDSSILQMFKVCRRKEIVRNLSKDPHSDKLNPISFLKKKYKYL